MTLTNDVTMKDLSVREVDRETIVTAARKAIKSARAEYGESVPTPLVRRLMKVARTHDKFSLGQWRWGDCGCLIGNLHGPGPWGADGLSDAEYTVGLRFDAILRPLRDDLGRPTILEVVS